MTRRFEGGGDDGQEGHKERGQTVPVRRAEAREWRIGGRRMAETRPPRPLPLWLRLRLRLRLLLRLPRARPGRAGTGRGSLYRPPPDCVRAGIAGQHKLLLPRGERRALSSWPDSGGSL